jgi:hypothetical protein
MNTRFLAALIIFAFALWSAPLVCSARTVNVANETRHSVAVVITYMACRSDRFALATGNAWSGNAGACWGRTVSVKIMDRNGEVTNSCSKELAGAEMRYGHFIVVNHGYGGCIIHSRL